MFIIVYFIFVIVSFFIYYCVFISIFISFLAVTLCQGKKLLWKF